MTINDAIYRVLKAQYKKELTNGELKILERYGFRVKKENGAFSIFVINGNDMREVKLYDGYKEYKVQAYNGITYLAYRFKTDEDRAEKFNYFGFLTAPVNRDYIKVLEYRDERYVYGGNTTYKQKRYRLKTARSGVRCANERIETVEKQIADLQRQLEDAIANKVRAEIELKNTRKELKLA